MTFKSPTQPLCRYCGAAIRKQTQAIWFTAHSNHDSNMWRCVDAYPATRDEAQRYSNHPLISVKWSHPENDYQAQKLGRSYIHRASAWDGKSYVDEFFCNGDHARRFAYAAARAGQVMQAYVEARDRVMQAYVEAREKTKRSA